MKKDVINMKIEDILNKLIEAKEDEVSQLYPDGREVLLGYIADLQRKEYNNSKAIEYIKKIIKENYEWDEYKENKLLNILEKGE